MSRDSLAIYLGLKIPGVMAIYRNPDPKALDVPEPEWFGDSCIELPRQDAPEWVEQILDLDGVSSVYVNPELGLIGVSRSSQIHSWAKLIRNDGPALGIEGLILLFLCHPGTVVERRVATIRQ